MSDSLPIWEGSVAFFEIDEADQRRLYALAMAGGDARLLALVGAGDAPGNEESSVG